MTYRLLVVESPSKVATVQRCLGQEFRVIATIGHFRDLPEDSLGVDLRTMTPQYRVRADRGAALSRLREFASGATEVLLGTDADREGEAIAWHVAQVLGLREARRVRFCELTPPALTRAVASPSNLDQQLVEAQQARRVMDRLIGYQVSPLLRVFGPNHSAGRVQSAALHLVVQREQERAAFVPRHFWTLGVLYGEGFLATCVAAGPDGKWGIGRFSCEADAMTALERARAVPHTVVSIESRELVRPPPPPFTTSTLQQAASAELNLTPARTMALAQALFEKGAITHHRTDSVALSDEALAFLREVVAREFPQALTDQPVRHRSSSTAQESHEAIRPTSPELDAETTLSPDEELLYSLLCRRALASQCKPAVLRRTTVGIAAGDVRFEAVGTVVAEDAAVTKDESSRWDEDLDELGAYHPLPLLAPNQVLRVDRLTHVQGTTTPPPRFTQATLIREMERTGIGRPSTYASTLATLFQRHYVAEDATGLVATPRGRLVDAALTHAVPSIVDSATTAALEAQLDDIAAGRRAWRPTLRGWYATFRRTLAGANGKLVAFCASHRPQLEALKDTPKPTGKPCPRCGQELLLRPAKTSPFLACRAYPECTYCADPSVRPPSMSCPLCGGAMEVLDGRFGARARCLNVACVPATNGRTFQRRPRVSP